MKTLGALAFKIRSKNAGPFWLTIDIFCDTPEAFGQVCAIADNARVAARLGASPEALKRYELPNLNVLKFSLPRPAVQGTPADRDMHGASFANLLVDLAET